jgi:hypothetical protein
MDNNTLKELRKLVNEVIYSSTKKDAQSPLRRLEFEASMLRGIIDPYLSGKLYFKRS